MAIDAGLRIDREPVNELLAELATLSGRAAELPAHLRADLVGLDQGPAAELVVVEKLADGAYQLRPSPGLAAFLANCRAQGLIA